MHTIIYSAQFFVTMKNNGKNTVFARCMSLNFIEKYALIMYPCRKNNVHDIAVFEMLFLISC